MKPEKPIATVVDDIRIKSWNDVVAPRAESLLSYLRQDIYQKGIVAYLRSMETLGEKKLLTGCKTEREDNFMRGYLVALKEFISMADQIEQYVEAKKNPPAVPGEYTA
jgi:hypothetical protein